MDTIKDLLLDLDELGRNRQEVVQQHLERHLQEEKRVDEYNRLLTTLREHEETLASSLEKSHKCESAIHAAEQFMKDAAESIRKSLDHVDRYPDAFFCL